MRCWRSSALGDSPPAGWRYAALEELAEVVSGGTPPRGNARYWGGSIPWATPTEVSGNYVRYVDSTRESITDAGLAAAGLRILPTESILVTTRATIGATARVRTPMTTNQGFQNLVPRAGTDPAWLFHAIGAARPTLRKLAAGSTFKEVSRESFRRLQLHVPTLSEQRAIAKVLDAIDDAIERGGAVVAATETLRQTLLHELLTRGMPGWHSEWKHVPPIGAVPARWTVTTLRHVLELDQPGTWGDEAVGEDSVPVLRAADFTDDGCPDLTRAPRRSVPKVDRDRRLLRDGDLVLERSGGGPGQPVGRIVMAQGLGRAYCSNFCQQLRVDPSTCRPSFALRALQHRHERGATLRMEQRTTGIRNLDYAAYLDFPFPLPTIPEQEAIAGILDSVYAYNAGLAKHLDALRAVKSSAADALLQGRVRTGHARLHGGST